MIKNYFNIFSHRLSSSICVNVFKSSPMSPSVQFSINRSTSLSRSLVVSPKHQVI